MSYWSGRLTVGTTGTQSYTLGGFQPTWVRFKVGHKDGVTETVNHLSLGTADGTRQNYTSNYTDATGSQDFDGNDKVILHHERVSGTLTPVLDAAFSIFTATGVQLSVTTASTAYKVHVECGT
jgi:hypothetical protein